MLTKAVVATSHDASCAQVLRQELHKFFWLHGAYLLEGYHALAGYPAQMVA